jgi:hypothetical protein
MLYLSRHTQAVALVVLHSKNPVDLAQQFVSMTDELIVAKKKSYQMNATTTGREAVP